MLRQRDTKMKQVKVKYRHTITVLIILEQCSDLSVYCQIHQGDHEQEELEGKTSRGKIKFYRC